MKPGWWARKTGGNVKFEEKPGQGRKKSLDQYLEIVLSLRKMAGRGTPRLICPKTGRVKI
jgi:hypothetical protein